MERYYRETLKEEVINIRQEGITKGEFTYRVFLIIIFTTFFIPYQIRAGVLGTRIGNINIIFLICIGTFLLFCRNRINTNRILYFLFAFAYICGVYFIYNRKVNEIVYIITSFLLPMLLIDIKVEQKYFIKILQGFLLCLNITIILITIISIIDLVIDKRIIVAISNFTTSRLTQQILEMSKSSGNQRLYSYMGHPLINAQLYIMFYVLNMLYGKYVKTILPSGIIILVSAFGVALTLSKTGLILFIISLIFIQQNKSKLTNFVIIILVLILVIQSGMFNSTIERFAGSLTTGRSEKEVELSRLNIYPIKFFYGYGLDFAFKYNNIIDWASAAFEYPYKKFALELGALSSILIYINIAILPIIKIFKSKKYILLIGFLIIFIDVNTYNGLALIGDNMIIWCLFVFMIENLINLDEVEKEGLLTQKSEEIVR